MLKEPRVIEVIASPEWMSEAKKVIGEVKWSLAFPIPVTQAKWAPSNSVWLLWSDGAVQQISP